MTLPMQKKQEMQVQSLDWEDPLEEEMATHSSILAWRIPWTEESGKLQSMGLQRVGHDWACTHCMNCIKKQIELKNISLSWLCQSYFFSLVELLSSFHIETNTFSPIVGNGLEVVVSLTFECIHEITHFLIEQLLKFWTLFVIATNVILIYMPLI